MAQVTGELEASFTTDFGILNVYQGPAGGNASTLSYASTSPGILAVMCGAKCPEIRARLELWDARPPAPGPEWEDCDEVPWRSLPGGGPVRIAGFDPPTGDGLDVEAFADARMQVLACGRHQYDAWDDGGDPERYLFRLWPEPMPDPLNSAPRRIAGRLPWDWQFTPWERAVHAWELAGWSLALQRIPAFRDLFLVIAGHGEPFTEDAIANAISVVAYRQEGDPWACPVLHEPDKTFPDPTRVEKLNAAAHAAGMTAIHTYADALTALVQLGLLCRIPTRRGTRFVPNPTPEPASDVLGASAAELPTYLAEQYSDYFPLTGDLRQLAEWSPGGSLSTSVRRAAVRLSVPATHVVGALQNLAAANPRQVDIPYRDITTSSTFRLTSLPWAPPVAL